MQALNDHKVLLEGTLLKPNMVSAGATPPVPSYCPPTACRAKQVVSVKDQVSSPHPESHAAGLVASVHPAREPLRGVRSAVRLV